MSFQSLKSQGSLLSKLNAELNKTEGKSGYIDERLWKPTMGKDGVGSAVIRFLPCAEGNEMPWAKVWSHAFQGLVVGTLRTLSPPLDNKILLQN